MEKAGTRSVQAIKKHPKRLSVHLWSTTMFKGLLLRSVTVMRACIRIKIDHSVTSFEFIVQGKLSFGFADDFRHSKTTVFSGGARESL